MDIKEKENRKKFKDLLYELGSSLDVLKSPYKRSEIYTRLESLYHNTDFRHYYSDIFSVLTTIKQDNTLGDIDILGQNLTIIKNGYKSINKDADGNQIDIQKQINKLFDHVSLDIARISYSDAANRQSVQDSKINDIKREINETQRRVDSMLNDIEVSQINIKTTQDSINNAQKEYIAILGIFAAVVITFVGGIAFSTSVLQNIHQSSIYRIVFICLLIGLVLLNVICALFYFIERLVQSRDEEKKPRNSFKPFIIINVIMLVLILITFVCWSFGCVEHRNNSVGAVAVSESATPSEYN